MQSNWGSLAWEREDVSGCDTVSGAGSMEEQWTQQACIMEDIREDGDGIALLLDLAHTCDPFSLSLTKQRRTSDNAES